MFYLVQISSPVKHLLYLMYNFCPHFRSVFHFSCFFRCTSGANYSEREKTMGDQQCKNSYRDPKQSVVQHRSLKWHKQSVLLTRCPVSSHVKKRLNSVRVDDR